MLCVCARGTPLIESYGYAVVEDGAINMNTVYPTERGAVVNWLCVVKRVVMHYKVTDDTIWCTWEDMRGSATICRVLVTVVES